MKIVSFNIRCDYGQDGENNYSNREEMIYSVIGREKPDIIGFQEVLPHVRRRLEERLTEHLLVGCGRGKRFDDESMTIALRKDSVELLGLDTFWLSDTPEVPGSRFQEQSNCPRICTHVLLRAHGEARPFHVYNTHLDHVSSKAREIGLGMVLEKIQEDQRKWTCPLALMGDFNATPDSVEMQLMQKLPWLKDASTEIPYTFHEFGRREKTGEAVKIDYIFLKGFKNLGTRRWMDRKGEIFLSDHYPVETICEME